MRMFLYFLMSLVFMVSCEKKDFAKGGQYDDPGPSQVESSTSELQAKREAHRSRRSELKRATGLPTVEERNKEIARMVWDSLESDPEFALEGLDKLVPGSEEKNHLIQHLALKMAEKSADHAMKWAAQRETEEEKSLAYGNIAIAIAESDPVRAAGLLSEKVKEGPEGSIAVTKVAQRWAIISPERAAGWIQQFNAGESREAGLRAIISSWRIGDPSSAEAWISKLPTEVLRKEAIRSYAEVILEQPDIIRDSGIESPTYDQDLDELRKLINDEVKRAQEKRLAEEAAEREGE